MRERNYFGCMMVETGEADALITGLARKYPDTIRPALEIIGPADSPSTANPNKSQKISGMYAVLTKKGPICYADTTITEFPTSEELVDITLQSARTLRSFEYYSTGCNAILFQLWK